MPFKQDNLRPTVWSTVHTETMERTGLKAEKEPLSHHPTPKNSETPSPVANWLQALETGWRHGGCCWGYRGLHQASGLSGHPDQQTLASNDALNPRALDTSPTKSNKLRLLMNFTPLTPSCHAYGETMYMHNCKVAKLTSAPQRCKPYVVSSRAYRLSLKQNLCESLLCEEARNLSSGVV